MTEVDEATIPAAATTRRLFPRWRLDATLLAIVTILIRIPAFFADRSLVFDDGVFASSALAMRNGDVPFRDIFSSQGPVFLPLLWLADLVGFRTMDAPRVLPRRVGRAARRSRSTRARAD